MTAGSGRRSAADRPAGDMATPMEAADERGTLLGFLGYLRTAVVRKLDGVGDVDARRRLVPSGTTLAGLVNHLAGVERYWLQRRFAGLDVDLTGFGFELAESDTVAVVVDRYQAAVAASDEIIAACDDLDTPFARPVGDLRLRWVLVHLIEETGRHAGHADILRELIDGAVGR